MRENVTVIFKSFERQKMAKRLYENLQKYYPGVRVVIADDSRKPLDLQGDSLTIIQLPFNSGLSYMVVIRDGSRHMCMDCTGQEGSGCS